MGSVLAVVLLCIAIGFVIFLIGRELANWYFKINERIKLQKQNNILLRSNHQLLSRIAVNTGSDKDEILKIEIELDKRMSGNYYFDQDLPLQNTAAPKTTMHAFHK